MSGVSSKAVPATLTEKNSWHFWLAVVLIGLSTGLAAGALTWLLVSVQHLAWKDQGNGLLASVLHNSPEHIVMVLLGAGLAVGVGQIILRKLTSGNGIEITEALWFRAGRMPAARTLGSAVLSVITVGMGAPLGREGAPKQAGSVLANFFSDRVRLSDEQRRLLVACGAGAGLGAAYGVPVGGALFALEVLRGTLALRLILPALLTSLVATSVSWIFLPNAPTYHLPTFSLSASIMSWALLFGPIAGLLSVLLVRSVAWADRNKPRGRLRILIPIVVLALIGGVATQYPQILGNGKDVSQLTFVGEVTPGLLLALIVLRPLATFASLACGAPGGLFTPTLSIGAIFGGILGMAWLAIWPGVPVGNFALVGAAALLAASTQGPISTVVLMIELTGHDRSFIAPMLLAVIAATLVARTIEPRSIYEARLSDEEVANRLKARQALSF